MQLQYGSIGWSVGATLGYAVGRPKTRMLSLIGDGSFQVTAQVVAVLNNNNKSCFVYIPFFYAGVMWVMWGRDTVFAA